MPVTCEEEQRLATCGMQFGHEKKNGLFFSRSSRTTTHVRPLRARAYRSSTNETKVSRESWLKKTEKKTTI